MTRLGLVTAPIHIEPVVADLEAAVRQHGEGCGAVSTFVGVVRATHQGRRVRHLDYEAHPVLALRSFERIATEVSADWPDARLAIHHRCGRLVVGEVSVLVAAAAAHRAEAFQVCRYAIERVKQISPIWKHEFFEDGDAWVEGSLADPDDAAARKIARERACA